MNWYRPRERVAPSLGERAAAVLAPAIASEARRCVEAHVMRLTKPSAIVHAIVRAADLLSRQLKMLRCNALPKESAKHSNGAPHRARRLVRISYSCYGLTMPSSIPGVPSLTLTPIGVLRTPFHDRVSAPRQPYAADGAAGTVELFAGHGYEHALSDLEGWDRLWILFWFHLNEGWRPKVLPPRSAGKRRGVFSTRSPHRPNPIGLSVVRLDEVRGLTLRIRDVDMIDGSPVLDIKPYVPYADAHPGARTGWLEPLAPSRADAPVPDPEPGFAIQWSMLATEQARWLLDSHGIDLVAPVNRTLALGPQPHPYRRIRLLGNALLLAVKDWRIRFRVDDRLVTVLALTTGYRARQLVTSDSSAVHIHRDFIGRFGVDADTDAGRPTQG